MSPTTNPLFNTGQSTIQTIYEDLASHGEELNIVGGITKDLSVIASYTNRETARLHSAGGSAISPTTWRICCSTTISPFQQGALKNSDVFVGVIHQGNVAGETVAGFTSLGVPEQPGYYVAAFTVVNAGAGYRVGNYRFNLNVNNVFNQHFWWQAQARSSLAPYPGITVTLTVTVHL